METKKKKLSVMVVKNLADSTKRTSDTTVFAIVWIIRRNMGDNRSTEDLQTTGANTQSPNGVRFDSVRRACNKQRTLND